MARPLRLNWAVAWCHVAARGNERKAIFWDDRDRLHFVELLRAWLECFRLGLQTYVREIGGMSLAALRQGVEVPANGSEPGKKMRGAEKLLRILRVAWPRRGAGLPQN